MNRNWRESVERIVDLPDEDPSIFKPYMNLIYSGTIPTVLTTASSHDTEYLNISRLYVLCEVLQDTKAKSITADAILLKSRTRPDGGIITFARADAVRTIYDGHLYGVPPDN